MFCSRHSFQADICDDKRHCHVDGDTALVIGQKGITCMLGQHFNTHRIHVWGVFDNMLSNMFQKSKPNVDSTWLDLMEVLPLHRFCYLKKKQTGKIPKIFQQMVPGQGTQIFPIFWGIKMKVQAIFM